MIFWKYPECFRRSNWWILYCLRVPTISSLTCVIFEVIIALLYSLAMTLRVDWMYLKTQSSSIPPCCCETCREWNKVPGDQSAGWVWWCAAGRVMCLYVHAMIINLFAVSNVSACLSILSNQGQQRHSNKNKTITFQTKLSCLTGHLWHLNIDTHACQSLCYTWSDTAKKARQAANWDHQEWYPQSKLAMPMGNLCGSVVSVIVIAITESPVPSRKVNKYELPIVDMCLSTLHNWTW